MTTLATCWKITPRGASALGFTDHDADLTVSTITYKSAVGYVASSVERNTGLSANNQEVRGVIDSVELTDDDLRNGYYEGARVEVFTVDWTNPAGGAVNTLYKGHIGAVSIDGEAYSAELLSIEHELSKPALKLVSARCPHDLGDAKCDRDSVISLTPLAGTVTSVTEARRVFIDTSLTAADGFYDGGKVVWTSGDNNGRTMDVKKYTAATDTVELYEPMPADIAIGNGYNITRGCDKTFDTCVNTFSNGDNFGGFPHVPGISDLVGRGT